MSHWHPGCDGPGALAKRAWPGALAKRGGFSAAVSDCQSESVAVTVTPGPGAGARAGGRRRRDARAVRRRAGRATRTESRAGSSAYLMPVISLSQLEVQLEVVFFTPGRRRLLVSPSTFTSH